MKHSVLTDGFGRVHDYLRVSVVEQCNLRCRYCMPEEPEWTPRDQLCTTDELLSLIRTFLDLGVRKIRLTGGEPLVRKDISRILKELTGCGAELSMTTNGTLTDRYISELKSAGVYKLNVSLDTLRPERFEQMTRRTGFHKVFENIHLLIDEGFSVKVNAVIMRGSNDDELTDFIEWTRVLPVTVRFIEFMPFGGNKWRDDIMVSKAEMMERVHRNHQPVPCVSGPNDTTSYYRIEGFRGRFGIISSMTEHFCGSCNRIRLLANGSIKNCLFSEEETSLLGPLRNGEDIEQVIRQTIAAKHANHGGRFSIAERSNRSMVTIGG
jgi:molybdenum cofactor biosynthesis protein A